MPPTPMNKCIVTFKESTSADEIQRHADEVVSKGGHITNMYSSVLKGFAAFIPYEYLNQLQSLTGANGPIDYIEEDQVYSIQV